MAGVDWTQFSAGGSSSVDWGQHGGVAPVVRAPTSSGGGGGGPFGFDLGHYWDEATGALSHGLTHGFVGGNNAPLLSHLYHQSTGFLSHIPDLVHVPGMALHDVQSPNNVSLIELLQNPSSGWGKINRQLHDPKGLIGSNYTPVAADVNAARHGNWHYFEQHPLNVLLDVGAAASLGGVGALKLGAAGRLGSRAEALANTQRVIRVNEHEIPLNQARTLQGRYRQKLFDQFSTSHPDMPVVGVNRRGARLDQRRELNSVHVRAMIPVRKFQRITAQLTPAEKFAYHVAVEPVPLDARISAYTNELRQRLTESTGRRKPRATRRIEQYLEALSSPEVRDALQNPRPQFVDALEKGTALGAEASAALRDSGELKATSQAERVNRPRETLLGAEPSAVIPETNIHNPLFPTHSRFRHVGPQNVAGAFTSGKIAGALGKQDLKQRRYNAGVLLRDAMFMTDPEHVVATDFLQTLRHQSMVLFQKNVLDKVGLDPDANLVGLKKANEHWYRPSYDRKTTVPIDRNIRAEQVLHDELTPLTEASKQARVQKAGEGIVSDNLGALGVPEADWTNAAALKKLGVKRVPAAYGKDFKSEFSSTPFAIRAFVDKPLDVWRAITLNFRPAWAVNNLVGNAIMGLATYGPRGAAWYLRVLLAQKDGWTKFLKVWRWTKDRPRLERAYGHLFAEAVPESHSAGLFGTQTRQTHIGAHEAKLQSITGNPVVRGATYIPKKAGRVVMGVGRGITKLEVVFAEDTGREAAFMAENAANFAKMRATARKMGEANLSYDKMVKSLSKNDVQMTVEHIADALGDFNDLSGFERAVLRRFIPFYSWYKVITKVSGKYAARYPARLLLLKNIQQAQDRSGEPALPSWLAGSQLVGKPHNGVQSLISTQGLNPYETIPQTLQGGFGSLLNPYGAAGVTALTGANPTFGPGQDYFGFGANSRGGFPGQLELAGGSFVGNLPLSRLIAGETAPYSGKLYDPKTYRRNLLLQYLGLPLRDVKVQEAKRERGL